MEKVKHKSLIFYHGDDFDGKCSAAIAHYHQKKMEDSGFVSVSAEFCPVSYGDSVYKYEHQINRANTVFILDFSFPEDQMKWLMNKTGYYLIWIDHHISTKEIAQKFKDEIEKEQIPDIEIVHGSGCAACELTWDTLFSTPIPDVVRLLGRYDVWDHSDIRVLPFQYGMRASRGTNPWNPDFWFPLFENGTDEQIDSIIQKGEAVLIYQKQMDERACETMVYPVEYKGHKGLAANVPFRNSQLFGSIPFSKEVSFWTLYYYKRNKWVVNIYAREEAPECLWIAEEHGGGGHLRACGFTCDTLPDWILGKTHNN